MYVPVLSPNLEIVLSNSINHRWYSGFARISAETNPWVFSK